MLKRLLKNIASLSPFPYSKNDCYDRLTKQVIKKVCNRYSVCVDIGANEGRILHMFINHCSAVVHFAFEPIPDLYFRLTRKYGSAANIYKLAVSDKKGTSCFNYIVDDPAYSSLQARRFKHPKTIRQVDVKTDLLDNIIPSNIHVTLIKLDIEGGEFDALTGAAKLIDRCKPAILFEFGKGGADAFNVSPKMIFELFSAHGYKIYFLHTFLKTLPPLTLPACEAEYAKGREYFFIASV